MNRILFPAAAALALLAPAAARAQSQHWVQQPWHLKALYLAARLSTVAHSSESSAAFFTEAHAVVGRMEGDANRALVLRYRALLVALEERLTAAPWETAGRPEVLSVMSRLAAAASKTSVMAVFFESFDAEISLPKDPVPF